MAKLSSTATKEEKQAYNKDYYARNKERMKKEAMEYYETNRDKRLAQMREYREAHIVERREYNKIYNTTHKVERKARDNTRKPELARYKRMWGKKNRASIKLSRIKYLTKLNLANKHVSQRTIQAWATQVKALCPFCNWCFTEDNLEAHHILPQAKFPEHILDLKNGLTLCLKYHDTCHSQGGF